MEVKDNSESVNIKVKLRLDLGDIQKTLLLPLWGRAVETQKDKPLLIDRTAVEIIEKIDYDFSTFTGNINEVTRMGWIIRSLHIDKTIKGFLEKHPEATIVNIGCGFDTTFNRVDNGLLKWFDLDMPDVIEARKLLIPERVRQKYISSSFLDEGWLETLKPEDNILFIAAGVLYYFEENLVKGFFIKIADIFPECKFIFDASSPLGIKMANKMVIKKSGMDERSFLKWGLKKASSLTFWDKRIEVLEEYPFFKEESKMFKNKFIVYLSDALKMQYMVHIKFIKTGL